MNKKTAKIVLAVCFIALLTAAGGLGFVMWAVSTNSFNVPPWSAIVLSAIAVIASFIMGMSIEELARLI